MSIASHALDKDFPEYSETIKRLNEDDLQFKTESDTYHRLDKQIRGLEERGVATDDNHFNALKIQRAHLKDWLYHRIADSHRSH
ncbi:YdcH family protein [Microbulbifer halophilus]|uniref:YdcH family protein n=1 Tax=Microbulbifer halophilus TaxID=453963 RepID=A0ABW5EAN3_9GAMM|nr:YdcH family protein [Microbulbifer halophilus]MCW8125749.1 YdcH family protein [Microbulbifer halophilus]